MKLFWTCLALLISTSSFAQELKKEYIIQSNPFLTGVIYKTYRFEAGIPVEVIPNLRLEKTYETQVTTTHKSNIKIYTVGDNLYVLSEIDLKKIKRGELPLPDAPLMTFTPEETFFISLRNEQNIGTSATFMKEGLSGNSSLELRTTKIESKTGDKRYELPDHLGNVQVVVTDKLIPMTIGNGLDIQKYYAASVLSASDYYPFGMAIKNRSFSSPSYRYGFNGQEKDDEISGEGNSNTAMFWQYSPRIARRWNLDPKPNTSISQYGVFALNPILNNDILGDTTRIFDLSGAHLETIFDDLPNATLVMSRADQNSFDNYIYNPNGMSDNERAQKFRTQSESLASQTGDSGRKEEIFRFDDSTVEQLKSVLAKSNLAGVEVGYTVVGNRDDYTVDILPYNDHLVIDEDGTITENFLGSEVTANSFAVPAITYIYDTQVNSKNLVLGIGHTHIKAGLKSNEQYLYNPVNLTMPSQPDDYVISGFGIIATDFGYSIYDSDHISNYNYNVYSYGNKYLYQGEATYIRSGNDPNKRPKETRY